MAYWEDSSGYAICYVSKQAAPQKPEAYRDFSERKLGVESKNQVKKHTSWVFEEKIKRKNTNRKLIKKFHSENWVWRE